MKSLRIAAVASAAALTLSGCGLLSGGVYDTPLPGGADVGSKPLTIEADFEDVLDLVPQSSVKVDNVAVGRVDKIRLNPDGHSARVRLKVNNEVDLPAGTTARLQQTSLLGEKYVALVRPDVPVQGPPLKSGDRLGAADTSQAAQVEQVLGALSLVLNGGGIEQFQTISRELQKVSVGRPDEIKGFLKQMNTFVGSLDDRKEAITSALDGLNKLSNTLENDKDRIARVLDGVSPGMKVMVEQRKQFVKMLDALDKLSDVTIETLNRSQEDIVKDFELLEPILKQLAKAGTDLPNSLEILFTYPFPDAVLDVIKGDYMNVFVTTNFSTPSNCEAKACEWLQPTGIVTSASGLKFKAVDDALPSLLPPTDTPVPGASEPTISVPTPEPSKDAGEPTPTAGTPTADTPSPDAPDADTPADEEPGKEPGDEPADDASRENVDGDN
jgi:phospholipid/cholesterol/gamma-HCH transport system substrate-binding protein